MKPREKAEKRACHKDEDEAKSRYKEPKPT